MLAVLISEALFWNKYSGRVFWGVVVEGVGSHVVTSVDIIVAKCQFIVLEIHFSPSLTSDESESNNGKGLSLQLPPFPHPNLANCVWMCACMHAWISGGSCLGGYRLTWSLSGCHV